MRKSPNLLAVLVVAALALVPVSALSQDLMVTEATRMIQAGDYDEAIELLTSYTDNHPDDGGVLATLATAYHLKGDYENAVAMNRRAAKFPGIRQTALYNEACGLSLMGSVSEAHGALLKALDEGFLDFDLLANLDLLGLDQSRQDFLRHRPFPVE